MKPFRNDDEEIFEPFDGKGDDFLFEMANVPRRIHGLEMDIKLQIAQPGDKEYPHSPRVKVFRHRDDEQDAFVIRLSLDPEKIGIIAGTYSGLLNTGQFSQLLAFVRKYRVPLLNLWYRPGADILEMKDEMDKIDKGVGVIFYGTRRQTKEEIAE